MALQDFIGLEYEFHQQATDAITSLEGSVGDLASALTGDPIDYYVDPAGDDNNDGLTPGTPVVSIDRAYELACTSPTCGDVFINFADGIYTFITPQQMPEGANASRIWFQSSSADHTLVTIQGQFFTNGNNTKYFIKDLTFENDNSFGVIVAEEGSYIELVGTIGFICNVGSTIALRTRRYGYVEAFGTSFDLSLSTSMGNFFRCDASGRAAIGGGGTSVFTLPASGFSNSQSWLRLDNDSFILNSGFTFVNPDQWFGGTGAHLDMRGDSSYLGAVAGLPGSTLGAAVGMRDWQSDVGGSKKADIWEVQTGVTSNIALSFFFPANLQIEATAAIDVTLPDPNTLATGWFKRIASPGTSTAVITVKDFGGATLALVNPGETIKFQAVDGFYKEGFTGATDQRWLVIPESEILLTPLTSGAPAGTSFNTGATKFDPASDLLYIFNGTAWVSVLLT